MFNIVQIRKNNSKCMKNPCCEISIWFYITITLKNEYFSLFPLKEGNQGATNKIWRMFFKGFFSIIGILVTCIKSDFNVLSMSIKAGGSLKLSEQRMETRFSEQNPTL